jgi:CrcB protein
MTMSGHPVMARQDQQVVRTIVIALAGAAGALVRYAIGTNFANPSFPWPTLLINVAGSFLLGLVLGRAPAWSTTVTTGVTVGFLGAFTTFSTFAFEATSLVRDERPGTAAAYVLLSVVLGLAAAAAGWQVGRTLAPG